MVSAAAFEITIEFFGPFRRFGTERDLVVNGPVGFAELLDTLTAVLGPEFAEQAGRRNTTVIVNNRIASRQSLVTLEIEPGDKVAFALLLGGG